MEVLDIAKKIEMVIEALKVEGKRSEDLIKLKADAMCVYDKAIGVRSLIHRDAGMAVTMIGHQAKADSSQLLREKVVAEETLKAHYSRIETLRAQLNGYQSIYRNLDST